MKRTAMFLHSLVLASLLTISSCGSDNSIGAAKNTSGTSTLVGQSCNCTSEYKPVCDTDTSTSHENICKAQCVNVKNTMPANCAPMATLQVCARNKNTYALSTKWEDDAVYESDYGRNSIQYYGPCR